MATDGRRRRLWQASPSPSRASSPSRRSPPSPPATKTIGKLIAEAMEKVGNDGVITVEESKTMKTELNVVEGMQFDRGYASAYMVHRYGQDGSRSGQPAAS